MRGLKLRVPESLITIKTFDTMGASVFAIPMGELFTALQTGTVDGQENPTNQITVHGLHEVQKYYSLTGHMYLLQPLVISTKLYNSFQNDIKKIIKEAAIEAGIYERQLGIDSEKTSLDELEELGMQINEADIESFRESVLPVYKDFEKECGDLITKIYALN